VIQKIRATSRWLPARSLPGEFLDLVEPLEPLIEAVAVFGTGVFRVGVALAVAVAAEAVAVVCLVHAATVRVVAVVEWLAEEAAPGAGGGRPTPGLVVGRDRAVRLHE
jgi:hypothetical protein